MSPNILPREISAQAFTSVNVEKSDTLISKFSLDDFPAELRVIILLQCPDISTLRALVKSSPLWHISYRDHRRTILSGVLHNLLPPEVFYEAWSVYQASNLESNVPAVERIQYVQAFLSNYSKVRRNGKYPIHTDGMYALTTMARLSTKIGAVILDYSQHNLTKNPLSKMPQTEYSSMTRSEMIRLSRGLYRFELFTTLFGEQEDSGELKDADNNWGMYGRVFGIRRISSLFLSQFAAWEVEEIICIGRYILDVYDAIMPFEQEPFPRKFPTRLDPELQENDFPPTSMFTPTWLLHQGKLEERNKRKEYCMSRGLSLFHRVKSTKRGEQAKVLSGLSGIQESILAPALAKFYDMGQSSYRRHRYSADNDRFGSAKFVSEESGPSAGFIWSRGQRQWNGDYVDPELRAWGYVFWDKKRLDEWGVLKSTPKQSGLAVGEDVWDD